MASSFFGCVFSNVARKIQLNSANLYITSKRTLLSHLYSCTEAWQNRLKDPILQEIKFGDFAVQLRNQYENCKTFSALDMEILVNKLYEMDSSEINLMEELIRIFRKTPSAVPVQDSIVYVLVRNYIDLGLVKNLLPLMQQRVQTGIFPDGVAFSLLLDHFIKCEDYAMASIVAYELILQENLDHLPSRLLALYATVHHFEKVDLSLIAPAEILDTSKKEPDLWVPIVYLRPPVYDEHFDMKCEQYLLGKALSSIGRLMSSSSLSFSLQIVGFALQQKFVNSLDILKEVSLSGENCISLTVECIPTLRSCLEAVQIRDPSRPVKDIGLQVVEDEMYKLLPLQEEQKAFLAELEVLEKILRESGKISGRLTALTCDFVVSELPGHEADDIELQTRCLNDWREHRHRKMEEQLFEAEKAQKVTELMSRLKDIQEKEELLNFFEMYDTVQMKQPKWLSEEAQSQDAGKEAEKKDVQAWLTRAQRRAQKRLQQSQPQ